MALAHVQRLLLNLTIEPQLLEQLQQDPQAVAQRFGLNPEEVAFARKLPTGILRDFQTTVGIKRSFRVYPKLARSFKMLTQPEHQALFLEFLNEHVMKHNEWPDKVHEFLLFAERRLADDGDEQILKALVSFDRWMLEAGQPATEAAAQTGSGYRQAANARVGAFPFPAELLITEQVNQRQLDELIAHYGTTGYILAQQSGEELDLFEIDACCHHFLAACEQPQSRAELEALAARMAAQWNPDVAPQEMIAELLEMNILVHIEKEGA